MTLCLVSTTDSCNVTLSRTSVLASPLESAVTKNASANPLGCAVTKSLDLKSPGMNSYKKTGGSPSSLPLPVYLFPFALCLFACLPTSLSPAIYGISPGARKTSTRQAQRTQKTRRRRPNETKILADRCSLRSAGDRGQRLERGRETLVGPRAVSGRR